VELIVQPSDGIAPVVSAVENAQKSLDIIIFRFDVKRLEKAVEAAVGRGVAVRALIAHTNRGGEKGLRELEKRMLNAGVMVSRTADDLIRYHSKMMVVDREELHVYGFNYTQADVKSRSFGIVTRDRKHVQEAVALFEADAHKQDYEPEADGFIVSPENAREQLASFLRHAKKQLMIWDPEVTDTQMLRLLAQRVRAGVDVRVIGKVGKKAPDIRVQKLAGGRLHVRAMVRDGESAFVGSQSLRALELDQRREIGLIVKDTKIVKKLADVFEADWARTELGQKEIKVHEKELALAETVA
jgi:cardiolipin synthase A/B